MTQQVGGARPLTAKGRATRDRIVAAAAELIFLHGVARTGVDDIQRRAGVSASQLYHYFADKGELVRAVIAYQTEAVLEAQQPDLDHLDSFAALERWRDRVVELQRQRHCAGGCPVGSMAAELAEDDTLARTDLVASFERWERPIRDGLRGMRDRGDLTPDTDTDALAVALLAVLQGGLLLAQTRRDVKPLQAGLDAVIAQIRSHATAE